MISRIRWPVWTVVLAAALLFFGARSGLIAGGITGTGLATFANAGCCLPVCQQTAQSECFGAFEAGMECAALEQCNVGCCIDTEGYCLSNYLRGSCAAAVGEFIATRECPQEPQCVTERAATSLLGFTGYEAAFPVSQHGILFTEPIAGRAGQPFTIRMQPFGNASEVRAALSSGGYQKALALYDDGSHGDGNAADGLFAAVWSEPSFPAFEGIRRVNVSVAVDGAEAATEDALFLTSTSCRPLRKPWEAPETRPDIIFVKAQDTTATVQLPHELEALFVLSHLAAAESLDALSEWNMDIISEPLASGDRSAARSVVGTHCTFYNAEQDTIIFFNPAITGCEQEPGMITVNPRLIFNQSALPGVPISTVLGSFCNLTTTEPQLRERIEQARSPPDVTLILPQNESVYDVSAVAVSFQINDSRDSALSYEIYRDINNPLMVLERGSAASGTQHASSVTLGDGSHFLWVEARDSDGNLGFSEVVTINVNVSNFVIDITSLEPLDYDHSPEINFTVAHAHAAELNYTILINETLQVNGTAAVEQQVSIPTALANGTYVIRISASDDEGRTAQSLPYTINVSNQP